jgi:excisionase family DNA binding protein
MCPDDVPLYVRLPAEQAQRLDEVSDATGQSKRRLVADAVREHLSDDRLAVGRIELREGPPEVLTLDEAATLLRVDRERVLTATERDEIPGRQIAGEWRFSREALLAWLRHEPKHD